MAPHIGLKHTLDDELQVVLKPFAWVQLGSGNEPKIHITDLLPELGQRYLFKRGGYTVHNRAYLQ